MQTHDKPRFATILTGIADYYGKELAGGVIELYWQGLLQYDLPAVERALWECTQNTDTGDWMPKISSVRRVLEGRTQDQAAIAWSKVDSAVRRVGGYEDVVFDDAIIHRVLADMGGWLWLTRQTDEEWSFIANTFQNRYRGYRLRNEQPDYPRVLIGATNAHNGKEGFQCNPPVLIGNQEIAKRVLEGGTDKPLLEMRPATEVIRAIAA